MSQDALRPQFAVQRPKGTSWKTLHIGPDRTEAERYFDAAKAHLRLVRLIQVDLEALDDRGEQYKWSLLDLHDSRGKPLPGARTHPQGRPVRQGAMHRGDVGRRIPSRPTRRAERIAAPLRLYLVVLGLGVLGGAVLYVMVRT
ncbi:MAG TPA: hypothetical protein VEY95_00735 [Azospirillaceae bacterium]|nr:hypothetical protein [Azospirillaceae bacterium]